MRINSISNYNFSHKQNFGAKLDNNSKALVRIAKENGINTDRMEELMEDLYPDGEVHTELFDGQQAKEKDSVIAVTCVLIGKPKDNEELFCDAYYSPFAGLLSCNCEGDSGGYICNAHHVSRDMVNKITQKLEEIKEKGQQ